MAKVDTTDWGTKKRIARVSAPGTFTSSGTTTVNLSTVVPNGTKAVSLRVVIRDATPGTEMRIRETGSTGDILAIVAQVNGINIEASVDVQLDSNYTFDINNSAALDAAAIIVTAVYL